MSLYELYYKLFGQERFPAWTATSFVNTVIIETVVLIAADSLSGASFGAIGIVLLTGLLVMVGIAINAAAGYLARKRSEFWGGRIAAFGVAVWIATIAAVYYRNH